MKLKKVDLVFMSLIFLLTIISIDFLINVEHREVIENISKYETFQNLGIGLLITFWVCVLGNLLPFPTPYTWVVCFSSQPFIKANSLTPLLVGFIAALGCLLGEIGGYAIGRGAAKIISEEQTKKLNRLQQYLVNHPKLAPFLIFLFAFTPLNDDLLTIPLGLIKYDAKKTILFIWLGKFGMMLIFAYNLVNICNLIGGESWILSIASLYGILIIIYFFIRVDFLKIIIRKKSLDEKNLITYK